MKRKLFVIVLLSLLALGVYLLSTLRQTTPEPRIARVESGLLPSVVIKGQDSAMNLAERMAFYKVPAVSIAVIENGRIDWAKAYGVLEEGGGKSVTTESLFQAASLSKPIAAMAALALVDEGKLVLDEDVNFTLKAWRVPSNDFTRSEKVTLRRLLSHNAGVNVDHFPGYPSDAPLPTLTQILNGEPPANTPAIRVEIRPGSQWEYSGGGFTIVQQLLQELTGESFSETTKRLVFDKIGMPHSSFAQPLPETSANNAARGHRTTGDPIQGNWHTYPELAAAGLWSTPSDLALFAVEVLRAGKGKSNKALSEAMAKEMVTKQAGAWGLGVGVHGDDRVTGFSHGGSNEGFTCIMVGNLETQQGAVIMTNGDRGDRLFHEILRAISQEYGWNDHRPKERTLATIDPGIYRTYVGEYNADGLVITISEDTGQLYIRMTLIGPQPVRLYPSTENRFFLVEPGDSEVRFTKDDNGKVTGLEAGQNIDGPENKIVAKKVK